MIADSDQGIARLWQAILQSPETLAEGYRSLWVGQYGKEREFYNEIRTRFVTTQPLFEGKTRF